MLFLFQCSFFLLRILDLKLFSCLESCLKDNFKKLETNEIEGVVIVSESAIYKVGRDILILNVFIRDKEEGKVCYFGVKKFGQAISGPFLMITI